MFRPPVLVSISFQWEIMEGGGDYPNKHFFFKHKLNYDTVLVYSAKSLEFTEGE